MASSEDTRANADRDTEHKQLIETSERLRDQLARAVAELDRYVQALQAEIERKRSRFQTKGTGDP